MTTTVIVHNAHHGFTVRVMDRLYDAEKGLTDEWKESYAYHMKPGEMWQGYCTDTRKIEVIEETVAENGS